MMNIRKIAAIYSLIIGISIVGMWSFFLVSNQVPELDSGSSEIILHLFAEFVTATLLIASGLSLLKKTSFAFHLFLVSLGMLLYTVIVSAGYYVDLGDLAMVAMFCVFQILTIGFILLSLFRSKDF